jgi:hypothetical protein
MPDLQNAVVKKVHSILAEAEGTEMKQFADYAYSGDFEKLRKLVAEILAFSGTHGLLMEIADQLCQPLLADLARCFKKSCCKQNLGWNKTVALHPPEYFFVGVEEKARIFNEDVSRGLWGDERRSPEYQGSL